MRHGPELRGSSFPWGQVHGKVEGPEEGTEAQLPAASRPQGEVPTEDLQQVTAQVEPTCSVEIVVPEGDTG